MTRVSDRNLLLGMLALRLGLVDRDVLLTALRDVGDTPHTSLASYFVEHGVWETTEQTVLDLAVDRYLAKHGDLAL